MYIYIHTYINPYIHAVHRYWDVVPPNLSSVTTNSKYSMLTSSKSSNSAKFRYTWSSMCSKSRRVTYIHTYIHTYLHTYILTCMHKFYFTISLLMTDTINRVMIQTPLHITVCIHTYIHTCTYSIHIHTYIHTYIQGLTGQPMRCLYSG